MPAGYGQSYVERKVIAKGKMATKKVHVQGPQSDTVSTKRPRSLGLCEMGKYFWKQMILQIIHSYVMLGSTADNLHLELHLEAYQKSHMDITREATSFYGCLCDLQSFNMYLIIATAQKSQPRPRPRQESFGEKNKPIHTDIFTLCQHYKVIA